VALPSVAALPSAADVPSVEAATAAQAPALPSHAAVVAAGKRAADYYRTTFPTTTLMPRTGWSWATWAEGVHELYLHAGDLRYQSDGMAWGRSTSWQLTTVETNPDPLKAGQVYAALHAVDATASLAPTDARMAADLTGMPLARYDWIDALFMGLANWSLWAERTGDPAYLGKMDALYAWTRDQGATSSRCAGRVPAQPGLFDAGAGLWYRDCTFVGVEDAQGQPVFWGRGNGWVIAAMVDVLRALPDGDPRAATYAGMLRTMAAALVPLQGADGFWRASLVNPGLFPQPETSGTGLITYALAYGVRTGVLDAATYLPVIERAWHGLTTVALMPSGFLTSCQPQGIGPAASYTAPAPRTAPTATSSGTVQADSPPFCVGAFLMAAAQVAWLVPTLSAGRPVVATAQETGNEAPRVVDGDVTTRWSAKGFPQAVTVDLGTTQTVGGAMVTPYLDRAYRYVLESSVDGAGWAVLADRRSDPTSGSQLLDVTPTSARYVRLTVTGVVADPTTWVSIQELAVYPPPATTPLTAYATDTFTRTAVSGLGAADVGGAWTVAGSATSYSVSGGVGRLRMSAGTARAAHLPSLAATDVDATVDLALDKPVTGGGVYAALATRHVGSSDYRAKVRLLSSGAVVLALVRVVDGAEVTLASRTVSGLVLAAGETVRVRFRTAGAGTTTLQAKVWRAATAEPGSWLVTGSDSNARLQGPGGVGVWSYVSGTATNAPVTLLVDNLLAVPPAG
jgi:rhamnogalacturonyl hydrolase YesR